MENFKEMNQSLENKKILYHFAKSPQGFLLLSGKNGTGKSYAAKAIYYLNTNFILPAYDSDLAIFITQASLNIEWQNSESKFMTLEKYKNVKLLIIDDLGTRTPSEAFGDFLYAMFDHRYNYRENLGTIVTTNLNSENLIAKFGDAIQSRICSNVVMRWDNDDRRLQHHV